MRRELARKRWNNMNAKTYAEPSREQAEAIAGNVRLLTGAFTDLSGESLPPSRTGVVFLDGFINRQRKPGNKAQRDELADMAACYLGEALITEIGGRWVQDPDNGLGVELAPKLVVFPFAKAAKHFACGTEDSVLSFFEIAELLAAEQRRAAPS